MKVTNFQIEPAMCVPGEEVTIQFTVQAESGDAIGDGGLYVYIAVSDSAETLCYRDAAFAISAGESKMVLAKTVLLSTSDASGLSRGTVLSSFGVQLGQYGARTDVSFAVTLLDAWYSPSISCFSWTAPPAACWTTRAKACWRMCCWANLPRAYPAP